MNRQLEKTLDYSAPVPAKRSPWPSVMLVFSIMGWLAALLLVDGAEAFGRLLLLVAMLAAIRVLRLSRGGIDRVLALTFLAMDLVARGFLALPVLHWFQSRIW